MVMSFAAVDIAKLVHAYHAGFFGVLVDRSGVEPSEADDKFIVGQQEGICEA